MGTQTCDGPQKTLEQKKSFRFSSQVLSDRAASQKPGQAAEVWTDIYQPMFCIAIAAPGPVVPCISSCWAPWFLTCLALVAPAWPILRRASHPKASS